ncbi:MAG: DUF190 domain-containing protein [Gammaproteobacteria bacterium]
MSQHDVTIVRVYLHEQAGRLNDILDYLHGRGGIAGWTVFRGVSGFGESGKVRAASLVDLSLDLPVIVEFFDAPERIAAILEDVVELAGEGHVVSWPATQHLKN